MSDDKKEHYKKFMVSHLEMNMEPSFDFGELYLTITFLV
jgi:hypothetical protein